MKNRKGFDYLERPNVIRKLWILLYLLCGLTVILEFFAPHEPAGSGGFVGFHAMVGFASCAVLILLSKIIGRFLKRKEGYYDHQ